MLRELVPSFWSRPLSRTGSGSHRSVDPVAEMQRQLNRVFEDFWRDFGTPRYRDTSEGAQPLIAPRVDIAEGEDSYVVSAELPGTELKDIEVSYQNGVLVISGEKPVAKAETDRTVLVGERAYGRFHREIPLNVEIDVDKIDAQFKNGVLEVHLPKTPEAKQRVKRIPVKA